jgi:putative membrane protein
MPYSKIDPDQMILRDHLAYDRTILANERTLLAYARTSIALYIAGGTLMKVLHRELPMQCLGLVLMVIGTLIMAGGVKRYIAVKKSISRAYEPPHNADS